MNAPSRPSSGPHTSIADPAADLKTHEWVVTTVFTEQHLVSREIEEQTSVEYRQHRVFLWVAIKSVVEECLTAWMQMSGLPVDTLAERAGETRFRAARELNRLVLAAYANPLGLKAVARVTHLGINACRTLDVCLESLLGYSTQRSADETFPRPALRIDWALGGLAEWPRAYPFVFEQSAATELAKNRGFYTTERNARKDITAKQIANIFCTTEDIIESLEARALGLIRKSFKYSDALDEYSQDFLASH